MAAFKKETRRDWAGHGHFFLSKPDYVSGWESGREPSSVIIAEIPSCGSMEAPMNTDHLYWEQPYEQKFILKVKHEETEVKRHKMIGQIKRASKI